MSSFGLLTNPKYRTARRSRSRSRPASAHHGAKPKLPQYTPFRPPLPLQLLNDFLHWSPIADAVVYTVFWSFFALFSAVCAPIYLIFLRFPFVIVEQSYRNVASLASTPPNAEHIIVVTGCDTGFGYDLALKFLRTSKKQFTVFAYCYSDAGCKRVNSLNSDSNPNQVIAVKCDVTDEEAVVSAATNVRTYLSQPSDIRRVFHGLINNAGVGSPGTIDMIPVMQSPDKPFSYQRDIEVNYYGALRVTKSLLPIFKAQFKESGEKTSLINVTSMAGLVPSPFMSAYAGSKHALEAASTCMRNELCTFGINVCTVNPSFHGTPLVDGIGDGVEALWQSLEGGYGVGWFSAMKVKSIQGSKASEWRAHNVTEICFRASLYKESGQRMVGTDAKYLLASLRHLPRSIQDFMVSGHPFAPFYVGGNVEV